MLFKHVTRLAGLVYYYYFFNQFMMVILSHVSFHNNLAVSYLIPHLIHEVDSSIFTFSLSLIVFNR
jgi:hypothetical protein